MVQSRFDVEESCCCRRLLCIRSMEAFWLLADCFVAGLIQHEYRRLSHRPNLALGMRNSSANSNISPCLLSSHVSSGDLDEGESIMSVTKIQPPCVCSIRWSTCCGITGPAPACVAKTITPTQLDTVSEVREYDRARAGSGAIERLHFGNLNLPTIHRQITESSHLENRGAVPAGDCFGSHFKLATILYMQIPG
jgi:hypothetical protein